MHLPQRVIMRLKSLLPMLYTPRELEEELGLPARVIRSWRELGMPSTRDANGFIWINGIELSAWYDKMRQRKIHFQLAANEAYCVRCRKVVVMQDAKATPQGKSMLIKGRCSVCGGKVNRGGRRDSSQ